VGRDPSTVSYWVNKHGLVSLHAKRHAPKGRVDEARLRELVERGLSIRQIATEIDRAPSTVRHWLRRFGLSTQPARYAPRDADPNVGLVRECLHHGWTPHRRIGAGSFRCITCASATVARRRRELKALLVAEHGGACGLCGYDRHIGALQFHHLDPRTKSFEIAGRGLTRSLDRLRAEAAKCVLLCANCHAEVESGGANLRDRDAPPPG